jgi:hypothetical protein
MSTARNPKARATHRAANAKWRAANPGHHAAWVKAHPEMKRASNVAWEKANPEKKRAAATAYARRVRGMPEPTRARPELCEINGCLRAATHLDHDHVTGAFRGWLCATHNLGLGAIGDTLQAALATVDYLVRAQS